MKKELPERFKAYKHVWVIVELERGQVHPVSLELLGEGRKLADKLGVELAGVVDRRAGAGRARPRPNASTTAPTSSIWSRTRCSPNTATSPTPRR